MWLIQIFLSLVNLIIWVSSWGDWQIGFSSNHAWEFIREKKLFIWVGLFAAVVDIITKSYIKIDKLERIFASPLAKRIAKQRDIPLSSIKGSGPHGRILKIDVDNFDIQKIEYPGLNNLESKNFETIEDSRAYISEAVSHLKRNRKEVWELEFLCTTRTY